jgi:hypothetical protein
MTLKMVYLLLCIPGLALPYWQFLPWLSANGLHAKMFFQQLFANRISAFFGMDVLVSAVVLLVFASTEARRMKIQGRWLVLISLLLVGVSLALPLFLFFRERQLQQAASSRKKATV